MVDHDFIVGKFLVSGSLFLVERETRNQEQGTRSMKLSLHHFRAAMISHIAGNAFIDLQFFRHVHLC